MPASPTRTTASSRLATTAPRPVSTLFPCHECAKTLVQAGIGEVVYLDDKYHDTEDGVVSRSILDRCGISYRQVVVAE